MYIDQPFIFSLCHRMIHRVMSEVLTVEELKQIVVLQRGSE